MELHFSYLGRSILLSEGAATRLKLAPNLTRPEVAFEGGLSDAVLYREAMGTLYAIVTSDLRVHRRSGSMEYKNWLQEQKAEEDNARQQGRNQALSELQTAQPEISESELKDQFFSAHSRYWTARRSFAAELIKSDPALWNHLIPCDPLITVAPDSVIFEVFSKDESSYGALSIDRDFFTGAQDARLGTTNVEFSKPLFEQIQRLRNYREARLQVDPSGFGVALQSHPEHREEKIELPASWLYGFGQLQAALSLNSTLVSLEPTALANLLRFLARHREKTGPRALRFELEPGKEPVVVLEPWEQRIALGGQYQGERAEKIRIWGRRRLLTLERALPLCNRVEVRLLQSGLPSVWTLYMGPARLTLALSGWTAANWTGGGWAQGAALELLLGQDAPLQSELQHAREVLANEHGAGLSRQELALRRVSEPALRVLARRGQVLVDPGRSLYWWRVALGEDQGEILGGTPHEELVGARLLLMNRQLELQKESWTDGLKLRSGYAKDQAAPVEVVVDSDGRIRQGSCTCTWNYRFRLRQAPAAISLACPCFSSSIKF